MAVWRTEVRLIVMSMGDWEGKIAANGDLNMRVFAMQISKDKRREGTDHTAHYIAVCTTRQTPASQTQSPR